MRRGRTWRRPLQSVRASTVLLIALLFLVEPVLRTGEILRPFAQVEIPPPRFAVGRAPKPPPARPRADLHRLPRAALRPCSLWSPSVRMGGLPAGSLKMQMPGPIRRLLLRRPPKYRLGAGTGEVGLVTRHPCPARGPHGVSPCAAGDRGTPWPGIGHSRASGAGGAAFTSALGPGWTGPATRRRRRAEGDRLFEWRTFMLADRGDPSSESELLAPSHFGGRGLEFRLARRDVAQSGSALQWGCRGRGFKSRRPDSCWADLRVGLVVDGPVSPHLGARMRRLSSLLLAWLALAACGCRRAATPGPAASAPRSVWTPRR